MWIQLMIKQRLSVNVHGIIQIQLQTHLVALLLTSDYSLFKQQNNINNNKN